VKVERHLEIREPLDRLEAAVVRRNLAAPEDAGPTVSDAFRYILSFARLTLVRNRDGVDVDVSNYLSPFAWRVRSTLGPHLEESEATLWAAVRELPALVAATRSLRRELLERFPLDRDSLEAEVCQRSFVIAAGGGGGAGYGYAGAYTLLNRHNLQPALMSGTSIGAFISLFRARRRQFDVAAMFDAGRRLSLNGVFKVFEVGSRYGLPATLRLHLHATLGPLFLRPDGEPMRMKDLDLPMRIVTTGLTSAALKHDLSFYEHFFDDAIGHETRLVGGNWRRLATTFQVIRDLMSETEALREIVFGDDPDTLEADVLDAAGFSASIPGIIHYDMLRDDPRMGALLERLQAQHGITRLAEGGMVDNVPARVAYKAVMDGVLGRRNLFVLAMDCFSPQARSFLYLPLQQLVRQNVTRNLPYAHLYFPLKRTLNPINMVPPMADIQASMKWTIQELKPHLAFIQAMCTPIPVLPDN
jgi:predicted acylesterase/phospholipase RssA